MSLPHYGVQSRRAVRNVIDIRQTIDAGTTLIALFARPLFTQ